MGGEITAGNRHGQRGRALREAGAVDLYKAGRGAKYRPG